MFQSVLDIVSGFQGDYHEGDDSLQSIYQSELQLKNFNYQCATVYKSIVPLGKRKILLWPACILPSFTSLKSRFLNDGVETAPSKRMGGLVSHLASVLGNPNNPLLPY